MINKLFWSMEFEYAEKVANPYDTMCASGVLDKCDSNHHET